MNDNPIRHAPDNNNRPSWSTQDPGQYAYGAQPGPYPQPPAPPQKPKRKPWKVFLAVVGGLFGGLLLLGIVASIVSPAPPAELPVEETTKAGVPAPAPSTPPLPPAASASAPVEQKTTQAPAPAKWVTLVKMTGSSNKSSKTITTTGGQLRLVYSFAGAQYVVGAIYFLDEGQDLTQDGGIPEVMVTEATRDSSELHKDAGRYYVAVKAANARYTVQVQELR
jgi:hypothetical protein